MKTELILTLFLVTMMTSYIYAEVGNGKSTESRVPRFSIDFGMQPEIYVNFNYHHNLLCKYLEKKIDVEATVGCPVALIQTMSTVQFDLKLFYDLYSYKMFRVRSGLSSGFLATKNVNGKFYSWIMQFSLQQGIYINSWFLGLHINYKPTVLTYIRHSEYVKSLFKDLPIALKPQHGWYPFTGQRIFLGAITSTTVTKQLAASFEGGLILTPNKYSIFLFGDIGIIPYYLYLRLAYLI